MKKDNPLKDKSYAFAVRIVKMYKYLCDKKHEYVLSKQVLRSGTSIGANIVEANGTIFLKMIFLLRCRLHIKRHWRQNIG